MLVTRSCATRRASLAFLAAGMYVQAIRTHDGAIRIVEVAMWGPAIRAGRAWHVIFTVVHGLEPEASFDEDGELLVGESTPEFRIRDEKISTILLARLWIAGR